MLTVKLAGILQYYKVKPVKLRTVIDPYLKAMRITAMNPMMSSPTYLGARDVWSG